MKFTELLIFLLLSCIFLSCENERSTKTDEVAMSMNSQDTASTLAIDQWTYIQIDSNKAMWGDFAEPEWLRYFGLATGDFDQDGEIDIITGRNVYFNPGKEDITGKWRKMDLGINVDANLYVGNGIDGPTIIAEALPDVYAFYYDENKQLTNRVVAQVPPTGHHNGQGYHFAQLGIGAYGEILLASQGGIYAVSLTDYGLEYDDDGNEYTVGGEANAWPVTLLAKDASDEGFAVADMDGDNDLDLVSGYRTPGKDAEVPTVVVWWENPTGESLADTLWQRHEVGNTKFATDRVEAADLNGDGITDVIVAEERYPGLEPDASLYVYFQDDQGVFSRKVIVTQFSMNNLDVADMDADGDPDLITSEHKGERLSLQIWSNDGKGSFQKYEVDHGKESHLGSRSVDIDGDGDLDIVSIGWDQHQFVHLWRNDAR